ncbi:NAD(P)H-hydrate dehydratase [Sphingomonas naphthae]|uniref:ADP-dependent (S)-NAD(P)H-hydrate dehydratase n=1 Tax=Sphingomonas naphthae TaxID=1813468 RepID=A0ABY7TNA0_9SPHN|nr:NAD(P)H-hydrate dehydratase [Sphingomonas naphthae]WCT74707.1 NAD(P)H-hydrate dehydratase [Sphingomonas naphthae]
MTAPLDRDWLAAHPLPSPGEESDKNSRGRVLAVGGSMLCPGGLMLTAEAALRAGAGKVRVATVAPAALAIGIAMPEAGVVALPVDDRGEIAVAGADAVIENLARADALVFGPAMASSVSAARLLGAVLHQIGGVPVVFDAAAIGALRHRAAAVRALAGGAVLTPHHGEMAALCGLDEAEVAADPVRHACEWAETFGAVVVLKGGDTIIAAPGAEPLRYDGGGVGLATSGSGDVLAGIVAGLLARGATPRDAAAWGVWLHGEAGRTLGPPGFLARELLPLIPALF